MTTPDPTANPPPGVLAYLNERLRRDDAGAPYFADDDGRPHIDITLPGCPNASARAVAAWTRTARPDLWQDAATVMAKADTAPSSTQTAAILMDAVKAGRMTANDAAARLLSTRPAETRTAPAFPDAHAYAGTSMSALMTRVRAGDASALADLTKRYLDPSK